MCTFFQEYFNSIQTNIDKYNWDDIEHYINNKILLNIDMVHSNIYPQLMCIFRNFEKRNNDDLRV